MLGATSLLAKRTQKKYSTKIFGIFRPTHGRLDNNKKKIFPAFQHATCQDEHSGIFFFFFCMNDPTENHVAIQNAKSCLLLLLVSSVKPKTLRLDVVTSRVDAACVWCETTSTFCDFRSQCAPRSGYGDSKK